jgi:hypothetical protein
MKKLFKDKKVIVSQESDDFGDIDFILVVNAEDYDRTLEIVQHVVELFNEGESTHYMLSDAVLFALEEHGISFVMPDFESLR